MSEETRKRAVEAVFAVTEGEGPYTHNAQVARVCEAIDAITEHVLLEVEAMLAKRETTKSMTATNDHGADGNDRGSKDGLR